MMTFRFSLAFSFFLFISNCKTADHSVSAPREFDAEPRSELFSMSPEPAVIDQVRYPRNGMAFYRGMGENQFGYEKAIRALFNDESTYVESFLFSGIKLLLQDKPVPFKEQIQSYLVEFNLEESLNQIRLKGPLDESSASRETAKIIDRTFYKISKDKLESHYLNYDSPEVLDFPPSVVFSTIYSGISALYGPRVLVTEEENFRSVDMNYWNFKRNGHWLPKRAFSSLWQWVDRGEFITWGYIPAEHIVGYQIRDFDKSVSKTLRYTSYRYTKVPIRFAFYRLTLGEETYVIAASGVKDDNSQSDCIQRNERQSLVHCKLSHSDKDPMPDLPVATSEFVKVFGAFKLCPPAEECQLPLQFGEHFPNKARDKLPPDFIKTAEGLSIKGKKVTYFTLN